MDQIEVAVLAGAIERVATMPDASAFPTSFAAELFDLAFQAASVVTGAAEDMLRHASTLAAPPIRSAADRVTRAEGLLIPDAAAIGGARARGDAAVSLSGYRQRVLGLLSAVLVAWRELAWLDSIRPWFTRYSAEAAREMSARRAALERAGRALLALSIPVLVGPPGPAPSVAISRRSRAPLYWGALAFGAGLTMACVAFRRR